MGESWERLARIGSMQKCILERKEQGMAVNPIGAFGTGRTNSDPYEGYYRAYYGNARNPLNYRQMMSGNDQNSVYKSEDTIKPGRLSAPSECQTCKNRKYQDGSNEMDVSAIFLSFRRCWVYGMIKLSIIITADKDFMVRRDTLVSDELCGGE